MEKVRFYSTSIYEASRMLNYSDRDILRDSRGEITHIYAPNWEGATIHNKEIKNSDIDPAIFGELNEENLSKSVEMGHIKLPIPVLNVNYLYGTRPILPMLLGMNRTDIDKVVYQAAYLVTKSSNEKCPAGKVLSEAELKGIEGIEAKTGAEAISTLMKIKKLDTNGVILHHVPVLPYAFRFQKAIDKNGISIRPSHLDAHYLKIMDRIHRLNRLIGLVAPEIVVKNEKRMLQECVDSYIDNGARKIELNNCGHPYDSLRSVTRFLEEEDTELPSDNMMDLFERVDIEKIVNLSKEIANINESGSINGYENYDIKAEDAKIDKVFVKIEEEIKPVLLDIVRIRYPKLLDFRHHLYDAGMESLRRVVDCYNFENMPSDKNDLKEDFFSGIVPTMDLRAQNLTFV